MKVKSGMEVNLHETKNQLPKIHHVREFGVNFRMPNLQMRRQCVD